MHLTRLLSCLGLSIACIASVPALAQSELAVRTATGPSTIQWQAIGEFDGGVLTVSGPLGVERLEFPGREVPTLDLASASGEGFTDGEYTWELRLYPVRESRNADANRGRARSESSTRGIRTHGYFMVQDGALVPTENQEEANQTQRIESTDSDDPSRDQVILDDLIVDGSACIGIDCVNGESFGFDTLRLKENNLRIKFQDTSNSSSFPTRDWQLTANDSANGGANKFSIDDIDGGRTPFTIEANAPSHSLYVDDGGRLGLGTATPAVEMHVINGDSPTLRLEQDGSSGFAPQTWDLAGNETNFFVRDVTNGSTLPLRIRPSAPSNSIFVDTDGDIGLGTSSPETGARLHVKAATGVGLVDMVVFENNEATRLVLRNTAIIEDDSKSQDWVINSNGSLRFAGALGWAMRLDASGNLNVKGGLQVSGTSLDVPDYVFDPDYQLLPLDELSSFVLERRHLPEIPSAAEVEKNGLDVGDMQLRLLKKVEELTLYTLEQQETIESLKARLEALEKQ